MVESVVGTQLTIEGSASILFNIFNIYVFGWRKSLRKKYIVFIFLEAAEVVNGVAYIITAARSSLDLHSLNPTQHCTVISSTHIAYCTAHFLFVVLAYVISFVTLLLIFNGRAVFMMTSLMCIIFMSIPACASLLIRWNVVESNDILLGISIVPPGLISIGTTMVNCIFLSDYRNNVMRIFCMAREKPTAARSLECSELVFPEKGSPRIRSMTGERSGRSNSDFRLSENQEIML
ncbi:unnamed protein product [Nippostrongylus brasiliensis]|uniref:G protein-coupled receptor n=1 Tax=Nippostrongylus brasiliensis TaxID=27835 RepID=A0A0N4Y105_NIPBR|nr:unnamed protein product [Nippostrongylus brasiliensis]